MFVTTYKDILFIEGTHQEAQILGQADIELMGIGAQLRNLRDVKERLYLKVKELGGNCLTGFEYGQKQRLLAFDDIAFYGRGLVARLPEEVLKKYFEQEEEE